MKLTETQINAQLTADFGGSLLFQPLSIVADDTARPVAMLATVAQLLPTAATLRTVLPGQAPHAFHDILRPSLPKGHTG